MTALFRKIVNAGSFTMKGWRSGLGLSYNYERRHAPGIASWRSSFVQCERVAVECYSGYKANERPLAFTFEGRRWEVAEIVDRWYEGGLRAEDPQVDYFKVRTVGGSLFLLRYVSLFDAWSLCSP